jgi:hypothetical protein
MLTAAAGSVVLASAVPVGVSGAARSATMAAASPDAPEAGAAATTGDPSRLTRSEFADRVGATYEAVSPWSPHRLRLDAVGDLAPAVDPENAFRLRFTTDDGARDGIYHLVSPTGARHVVYLSRVGPESGSLEAIVNRA